jgi:hypothetical protein
VTASNRDLLAQRFETHRARPRAVALRMLGSSHEAPVAGWPASICSATPRPSAPSTWSRCEGELQVPQNVRYGPKLGGAG